MKKLLLLIAVSIAAFSFSFGQQTNGSEIALIPQPASLTRGNGSFELPNEIVIIIPNNEEVKKIADLFFRRTDRHFKKYKDPARQ